MKMPVMSGYELAPLIKLHYNDTVIIAVSASSLSSDERDIKEHCDAFLRKPISRQSLIYTLSLFLEYTSQTVSSQNTFYAALDAASPPGKKELHRLREMVKNGDLEALEAYANRQLSTNTVDAAFYAELKARAASCDESAVWALIKE